MSRLNRLNRGIRVPSVKVVTETPYTITQGDDVIDVSPSDTSKDFFIRVPPPSMFVDRFIMVRVKKALAAGKYVKGQRVDGNAIAGVYVNNSQRQVGSTQIIYSNGRYWRAVG